MQRNLPRTNVVLYSILSFPAISSHGGRCPCVTHILAMDLWDPRTVGDLCHYHPQVLQPRLFSYPLHTTINICPATPPIQTVQASANGGTHSPLREGGSGGNRAWSGQAAEFPRNPPPQPVSEQLGQRVALAEGRGLLHPSK